MCANVSAQPHCNGFHLVIAKIMIIFQISTFSTDFFAKNAVFL